MVSVGKINTENERRYVMIPLQLYIFRQLEKKKAQAQRLEDQLFKLEVTATDKEENKEIALGTSKLNYLDPRITVAW